MRKGSLLSIGLSIVLAVILMCFNFSCGGDSAPTDPNAAAAAAETP